MLTRLRVNGFKNLMGVDLHFGPFTCIAGPNGIGKSNLLDAIAFLSAVAKEPFHEAALKVRSDTGRHGDIRHLFYRSGDEVEDRMRFEAEMLIPTTGIDDLGQTAKATISYLRYTLELRMRTDDALGTPSPLELVHESLEPLKLGDAAANLHFEHSAKWRKSVAFGRRSGSEFISTKEEGNVRYVRLHQDQRQGKPRDLLASSLPRTVLSSTNAVESPTAMLVRKEMEDWRILQLEPSLLREPDRFNAVPRISARGEHLAATLFRMAKSRAPGPDGNEEHRDRDAVYAQIANRLSELYEDIQDVWVDRDEKRELLTVYVRTRQQDVFPVRALSDGTLRFLALSVLEADETIPGLLCLEEPENGIHPHRIPYVIQLLQDMATDTSEAVSSSNPLRQVIVNTHSPVVAAQVPADSLLVAVGQKKVHAGRLRSLLAFQCCQGTWRDGNGLAEAVAMGEILSYLGAAQREPDEEVGTRGTQKKVRDLVRESGQLHLWDGAER